MQTLLISLAGLGSAALLLGALGFQYLGGLPPCELCITQRWPHLAAVLIWLLWLKFRVAILPWLGAIAVLISAGIGVFHAGVEAGWWVYISSCTQGTISGLSMEDLLNPATATAAPVRCDVVAWSFLGLSMAAWNAIVSFGLAALWVKGARTRR